MDTHPTIDITRLGRAPSFERDASTVFSSLEREREPSTYERDTSSFERVLNRLQTRGEGANAKWDVERSVKDFDAVLGSFVPGRQELVYKTHAQEVEAEERSPASSQSSSGASGESWAEEQAFYATRSRVVRLFNLPPMAEAFLSRVFSPHNTGRRTTIPIPATLWTMGDAGSVWAVFRTHEEAAAALALSGRAMSVATALEAHLLPFHNLQRFPFYTTMTGMQELAQTHAEYTLSSNPPNPKNSFRLGDWICPSPKCAAHNFGRNLACIGCGCPRAASFAGSGGAAGFNGNGNFNGQNSNGHVGLNTSSTSNTSNGQSPGAGGLNVFYQARGVSPRFANANANVNANVNGGLGAQTQTTYYSSAPVNAHAHGRAPVFEFHERERGEQQKESREREQREHRDEREQQQQQQQNPLYPASSSHKTLAPSQSSSHPTASPTHAPTTNSTHPSSATSAHPLLTPSGRAFAVGGRVQNISRDPLAPCVMYWPDNEPLPEPGQIRPSCAGGGVQPPILNTGNRGPISHQPGDWICQKCNYLNWRRRKVCQTCLPYAEGNGDSISAAVQAERIALLTSVLTQTSHNGGGNGNSSTAAGLDAPLSAQSHSANSNASLHPNTHMNTHNTHGHAPRSHSLTPPQTRRPFIDLGPSSAGALGHQQFHLQQQQQQQQQQQSQHLHLPAHAQTLPALSSPHISAGLGSSAHRPVHRSQSHFALGQQYHRGAAGTPPLAQLQQLQLQHQQIQQLQQQQQQHQQHQHSLLQRQFTSQSQQQQQAQQVPAYSASSPIYQTSGHRQPSPLFAMGQDHGRLQQQQQSVGQQHLGVHHLGRSSGLGYSTSPGISSANANASANMNASNFVNSAFAQAQAHVHVHAPAPLLPSFLQDIVQSPALSPTSTTTSSAELSSIEEYDEQLLGSPQFAAVARAPRARGDSGSTTSDTVSGGGASPLANIWRLDGEESKSLSAFPLPNHQELVGGQGRGVVGQERGVVGQERIGGAMPRGDMGLQMRA